jgi:hypothetical protein
LQKASGTTAIKKIVSPVETGVQEIYYCLGHWIPAFAGMTETGIFRPFAKPSKLILKRIAKKSKEKDSPTITQKIPTKTSSPLRGRIKVGGGELFSSFAGGEAAMANYVVNVPPST